MKDTNKDKKTNPSYFTELAKKYCDETLMSHSDLTYGACYYQGMNYVYDGHKYFALEERDFNHRIRTYCLENNIPQSNHLISNTAPIVQNLIHRDAQTYKAMPFYSGDDHFPNPKNIIAYKNGLLDLATFTLMQHTPHWVSPVCLPYDYDPLATCPQWLEHLPQWLGDNGQAELLQEWFGYCMSNDTSYQKFMLWVGVGGGGKGTIWDTMRAVIGEEASAGFTLRQLGYTFGLYPLIHKLVAFTGEAELKGCNDKGQILETLKAITGEDSLHIERKNLHYEYDVVMPTRLIIACNSKPSFVETAGDLSRRLLLLRFDNSFVGKEDYHLKDKLRAELSGINNWALEGLKRLRANGRFTIPEATQEAIRQFKTENSPTLRFMMDCLQVERRLDTGNLDGVELTDKPLEAKKNHILTAYEDWYKGEDLDMNLLSSNRSWLFRNIHDIIPKMKDKGMSKGRGETKVYYGIALKYA